jgi:hypothetical protein
MADPYSEALADAAAAFMHRLDERGFRFTQRGRTSVDADWLATVLLAADEVEAAYEDKPKIAVVTRLLEAIRKGNPW